METRFGYQHDLVRAAHIAEVLVGFVIKHAGPQRDTQVNILTFGALAVRTLAVLALLRLAARLEAIIYQRIEGGVTLQVDRSAIPAITTIVTAMSNIFFETKAKATISAFPGFYLDTASSTNFMLVLRF